MIVLLEVEGQDPIPVEITQEMERYPGVTGSRIPSGEYVCSGALTQSKPVVFHQVNPKEYQKFPWAVIRRDDDGSGIVLCSRSPKGRVVRGLEGEVLWRTGTHLWVGDPELDEPGLVRPIYSFRPKGEKR